MLLQYALFREVIISSPFLIFSREVLMDEMFSFLSEIACQSAIKGMLRNMSLLKTRLPGLLPSVKCYLALIACMAMDSATAYVAEW
jgi:hypothetical protein